jgi:hypothetical protein
MKTALAAAIVFTTLGLSVAAAQTPGEQSPPQKAVPASPANVTPIPPDQNANAPKAPSLPDEPHGTGSVQEELKATERKQGD